MSRNSQLDGMRVEHRYDCLLFERTDVRAVPRVAGVVAGVGERHGVAGVLLSRRSDGHRFAVAECVDLLMTVAARLRPIRGETAIVEKLSSQRELRSRLQVVRQSKSSKPEVE